MKYFRYLWYPIVLLLGNSALFLVNWDRIPIRIPRQYGFNGIAHAWWSKGMGFAAVTLAVFVIIVVLYLVLRQLAVTENLGIGSRLQKSAMVLIMYGTVGLVSVLNTGMVIRFMQGMNRVMPSLAWIVGAVLVSLAVGFLLLFADKGPKNDNPLPENPGCWKAFFFYYDPEDPKVLVEKRTGLGWTFNYAHKVSWVITGLIVAVPVLILFLVRM